MISASDLFNDFIERKKESVKEIEWKRENALPRYYTVF